MNDIIKDFHELTEIPVFQEMVPDKKYMDTEEHLDVLQMNTLQTLPCECRTCKNRRNVKRSDGCLSYICKGTEYCNDRYYRRCTRDESTSGISDRRKQ